MWNVSTLGCLPEATFFIVFLRVMHPCRYMGSTSLTSFSAVSPKFSTKGLSLWPFTLKTLLVSLRWISITPWEKTFKKTNGSIHLDHNFLGMNFNLELKSNTFYPTKSCLRCKNLSWRYLVRSLYSFALSYASNRISSSSYSCNLCSSPAFLASRLHCFTA